MNYCGHCFAAQKKKILMVFINPAGTSASTKVMSCFPASLDRKAIDFSNELIDLDQSHFKDNADFGSVVAITDEGLVVESHGSVGLT